MLETHRICVDVDVSGVHERCLSDGSLCGLVRRRHVDSDQEQRVTGRSNLVFPLLPEGRVVVRAMLDWQPERFKVLCQSQLDVLLIRRARTGKEQEKRRPFLNFETHCF